MTTALFDTEEVCEAVLLHHEREDKWGKANFAYGVVNVKKIADV